MARTRNASPTAPRPRVPVTEKHITEAVQRDSGGCMIAEAIKDAVPGAKSVTVDLQTIRWSDPVRRLRYIYVTPMKCVKALIDFDHGRPVDSFTFAVRNGMVTPMNTKNPNRDRSLQATPRRARLVPRDASNPGEVTIVGGSTPPMAAYSSRSVRRVYGLRMLER